MHGKSWGAIGAAALVTMFVQGCASQEPDDELRAGGIDNIVVRLSEDDLSSIVERVERLEQRSYAPEVVETFAIARAIEASRRADPNMESAFSRRSSISPPDGSLRPLDYLEDHLKLNAPERALCRTARSRSGGAGLATKAAHPMSSAMRRASLSIHPVSTISGAAGSSSASIRWHRPQSTDGLATSTITAPTDLSRTSCSASAAALTLITPIRAERSART